MADKTIKCRICGEPCVVYSHYAGDQSACPKCRAKARKRLEMRLAGVEPRAEQAGYAEEYQSWPEDSHWPMGGDDV